MLIFDEVITGFRVAPGGAQQHFGVRPDLTTLAKILAGGLPGGAVAGRADVLAHLEFRPGKPKMKHPGTFNANPLSASAGVAALQIVADGEPCRRASDIGKLLRRRLNELFAGRDADWIAYGEFSMFHLLPRYRGPRPDGDDFIPYNCDLNKLDGPRDVRLTHAFRQGMLLHGVDFFGLGGMTTAAHTGEDVERTVAAVAGTLDLLRGRTGVTTGVAFNAASGRWTRAAADAIIPSTHYCGSPRRRMSTPPDRNAEFSASPSVPPAQDRSDPTVDVIQVPGYEIQGELGRGGMGVVYLAKNVPMNRPEVLKVVNKVAARRASGHGRALPTGDPGGRPAGP